MAPALVDPQGQIELEAVESGQIALIGEIRDRETMEHALAFAETGHLAISTLHANNVNQALDRIINFFPDDRHKQLLSDLSINLRAIISQRLVPTTDGKRCAAIEILLASGRIADLIEQGEVMEIKEVMEKSEAMGMQTFDTALYSLYSSGKISLEDALKYSDSEVNLKLRIDLAEKGKAAGSDSDSDLGGLGLIEEEVEEEEGEEGEESSGTVNVFRRQEQQ